MALAASPAAARCPPAHAALPAPPKDAAYLDVQGAVRIVGYNNMRGLVEAWDRLYGARSAGVRFAPDLPATRAAPPALLAGRSALAPMGAEMTPQDLAAFRAASGAEPLAVRVAHDSLDPKALSGPLGVVVARGNPLARLSMTQVGRLFAADGGLATWGDLGLTGAWAARPIRRVGLKPETALAQFLRAKAFPGRAYAADLEGYGHSVEVAAAVGRDPAAIGFAAVNVASPEVRVVPLSAADGGPAIAPTRASLRTGRYPLDRRLLIYARRPLDPFARAYLALVLSCAGQAAVAADPLGYIPLSPREARAERAKLGRERGPLGGGGRAPGRP